MLTLLIWFAFLSSLVLRGSITNAYILPQHESGNNQSLQHNANHIFNVIYSSMRQFGSSLNHNGVSFFRATVPRGTRFYHGRHDKTPVTGMEWLAFEPEHALLFAQPHGRPRQRPPPGKNPNAGNPSLDVLVESQSSSSTLDRSFRLPLPGPQHSLNEEDNEPEPELPQEMGWLHIYEAKKDLSLIYVDGMSAAKCSLGTLDSQDFVLLQNSGELPWFGEFERAQGLCNLAKNEWSGKVNGFIRMEAGFEIILCSFSDNLDLVDQVRPRNRTEIGPETLSAFTWYKAIAARYYGIGGDRVSIDYGNFVTGFSQTEDLFNGQEFPRYANSSEALLRNMKNEVTAMVQRWSPTAPRSPNWQGIADMIVARYADSLQLLTAGMLSNKTRFDWEIDRILNPFINSDDRNLSKEVQRCIRQFIPSAYELSLAGQAIYYVSNKICKTLFDARQENTLHEAVRRIDQLKRYLDWTTWKECKGCRFDEICYVPIWPLGDLEDRSVPRCMNESAIESMRRRNRPAYME